MAQEEVPIEGMTCASCERRVTRSLRKLPGVDLVEVSVLKGTATLSGDSLPSRAAIDNAIIAAGYTPGRAPWLSKDKSVYITFAISAVAAAWLYWAASSLGVMDAFMSLGMPSSGSLIMALVLGLVAGVSTCMAMVGGLVLGISAAHAAKLAASEVSHTSFLHRMRPNLMFNTGRILGFTALGAVLGLLGSSVSVPIRVTALIVAVAALVMALLGMRLTGLSPRLSAFTFRLPSSLARTLRVDSAGSTYSDPRALLLGAGSFFLPCGFTQAVQLYALSTGSALTAGLVMGLFALGTTPGLLSLAAVPEVATGSARTTVLRVVGVAVLAFAALNFSASLNLAGIAPLVSASASASEDLPVTDNVKVFDTYQEVTLTQEAYGYAPANTRVRADLPIKWNIISETQYSCAAFLRVPELDLSVDLKEGTNTVDLPALAPGQTLPYSCSMGMYSGTITAVA